MPVIVTVPAGLMTAPGQPCIDAEKTSANMAPLTDNPRTRPRSAGMRREADLIRSQ